MSSDKIFLGFASIPVLGIAAQWFAWRFKLPAIIILLLTGFIVGPFTHFVRPDVMFGELLFPFVSVAVAIIIFEGGLSLKFSELRGYGTVVANLVTIGVLLSWMILSTAAYTIMNYSPQIAILIGAAKGEAPTSAHWCPIDRLGEQALPTVMKKVVAHAVSLKLG